MFGIVKELQRRVFAETGVTPPSDIRFRCQCKACDLLAGWKRHAVSRGVKIVPHSSGASPAAREFGYVLTGIDFGEIEARYYASQLDTGGASS